MSLAIRPDNVLAVLLADGWHDVRGNSFEIDSYEFVRDAEVHFGGSIVSGTGMVGAKWTGTDDRVIYCPLTSILAVKY
jgi:hypothetical protein